jgi:MFS family permease
MSNADYGNCVYITYGCSLLLSYPLGALADRFHPLRVTQVFLAIYAVVMISGSLWVTNIPTFSTIFIIHGVISGCMLTAWASMGQRLLPRSKFSEIASAGGLLHALVTIVSVPILGRFLDYTHHAYRLTFFFNFGITLLALFAYFTLYRKFMALGGPKHYVAPE